jgi:4-hydroxy-tetrahydrodipicolinate synthase
MLAMFSRREVLSLAAGGFAARRLRAEASKPMRGVFIIVATPYTAEKAVDYEDLANEVEFLERCGVHGMVWPQLASEYYKLTKEERMRGMEVLAKAARGRRPALVFGVQGPNTESALEYLRHAESLRPDAVIAIPPTEAKSADDYREYYSALATATKRPIFVQTTGGAKGITPSTDMLVELAGKHPHCAYIKEEAEPVIPRMMALAKHRPAIKAVFSGGGGRGMMYEMRLGMDGTMPGAAYSDIHAQIWDNFQAGRRDQAREIFSKLLLMAECDRQVPGSRQYVMKKRGVFKTTVSRVRDISYSPEAAAEIEFHFAALKPYLRA